MPTGGIIPARTFRMTFSHVSACAGMSFRLTCSSDYSPDFVRSLWQPAQYVLMSAACDGDEAADGAVPWAEPAGPARIAAKTRATTAENSALRKDQSVPGSTSSARRCLQLCS